MRCWVPNGTTHITRDANGRFVPGQSGNPVGKRPGTRNRASVLAEALLCGEAENIARVVIDKAVKGDAVAARFCLDRLSPRPRGRAIRLELPEGGRAGGDVVAMFNSALRALAAWRYRFQRYDRPWELRVSRKLIRHWDPRVMSL